ncbi:MAG: ATP-dependent sacrificial sulfur transferase LarE [Deltaproteobacteria bacterium]|nr:ATP-dependent sacrificial sulfur transferase LarE [Deltaproteobacteria bacterium]
MTLQLTGALAEKKAKLERLISRETRAAVACSGGVDSTLLLKLTHDVLGHENTIAVFAETPLLPPGEAAYAREVIGLVGSRLLTLRLNPLQWQDFTANPRDRCYLCKKKIYLAFREKLDPLHFKTLMDGTNLDDLGDFRPGLKAVEELGIKTPLAAAKMTKNDVRQLSRALALPNWDKHSSSCLATRIAAGQPISPEKLALIEECENFLHSLDFQGCRVRIADDSATIELQEEDISRFAERATRQAILKKFSDFSLVKIFLAMRGRNEKTI